MLHRAITIAEVIRVAAIVSIMSIVSGFAAPAAGEGMVVAQALPAPVRDGPSSGVTPAAITPLPVRQVAPGVFVSFGVHEEIEPGNDGAISNIGFIVGSRCVAVVDTGGSARTGRRLRAAIVAATDRPVCHVINTHVHPDHVFGNAAFSADSPEFVGHAKLKAALLQRAIVYRRALDRTLGDAAEGSDIVVPTREIRDTETIDLGDRVLRLRAWPTAHTDNDLTVFDERTGTLFTGDLLFDGHLPVVDGSARGWLKVMAVFAGWQGAEAPRQVIPGHGDGADWREALERQRTYVGDLVTRVRADIRDGRSLRDSVATLGALTPDGWSLVDAFHRRNITAVYAELEWE